MHSFFVPVISPLEFSSINTHVHKNTSDNFTEPFIIGASGEQFKSPPPVLFMLRLYSLTSYQALQNWAKFYVPLRINF